jgi:hypothetical protein
MPKSGSRLLNDHNSWWNEIYSLALMTVCIELDWLEQRFFSQYSSQSGNFRVLQSLFAMAIAMTSLATKLFGIVLTAYIAYAFAPVALYRSLM